MQENHGRISIACSRGSLQGCSKPAYRRRSAAASCCGLRARHGRGANRWPKFGGVRMTNSPLPPRGYPRNVMQTKLTDERRAFESTELAGRHEARFAYAAVLVSAAFFFAAVPFAT